MLILIIYYYRVNIISEKKNFKCYVGYVSHSNDSVKPLIIKLPKLNGSTRSF